MRLRGLLLVASFVGWGAQVSAQPPAAASANAVRAAKSVLAQVGEAPGKPANNKPTIVKPGQNKQTTAKPAKNKPPPAEAVPAEQATAEDICRTVEQAAAENQLPVNFFARLIWQESRFNARAVSRKGAQGIAQFMPKTANFRGLADPFDPISSIENAARYLGDLRRMFGNLGLAAAGYNAGPARVREWLERKGALPRETRNYVAITTGWAADKWASPSPPRAADTTIPQGFPCAGPARLVLAPLQQQWGIPVCVPSWGAQWMVNWSKARTLASYRALQNQVATLIADRAPIMLPNRFGSRGLPAACYNAERGRAREWLDGKGALIVASWSRDERASPFLLKAAETAAPPGVSSAGIAHLVLATPQEAQPTVGSVPRWGAQLTANWSQAGAWATYRTLQKRFAALIGDREPILLHGRFPGMGAAPRYMVRIADDNKEDLEKLCEQLIAAGGACAVLRNDPSFSISPPAESESE